MLDEKINQIKKGIPKDLWLAAKGSAHGQGLTLIYWISEAIREKLNNEHNK